MKIVIDIPENTYHRFINGFANEDDSVLIEQLCKNGNPYEDRPTGKWIPVSERLPDDMQSVLIWFEYYRYGKYGDFNCMHQTYGFGYVCDGKWSSFINGETGWQDARIIAWMPLPEAYEKYKEDISDMRYTEGLIYIAKKETEND